MLRFEDVHTYIRCIDGRWYAFAADDDEVYSIGSDCPTDGQWFGRWTDDGIKYVANYSPTRNAAYQKARRHGVYCGEG